MTDLKFTSRFGLPLKPDQNAVAQRDFVLERVVFCIERNAGRKRC